MANYKREKHNYIISCSRDSQVTIYRENSNNLHKIQKFQINNEEIVLDVCFLSEKSRLIYLNDNGFLKSLNIENQLIEKFCKLDNCFKLISFNKICEIFIIAGNEKIYTLSKGFQIMFEINSGFNNITSIENVFYEGKILIFVAYSFGNF